MELRSLKRLRTLMAIHDDMSGRDLAEIAGYKSHTYIARVLRGEYKVIGNDHALRIAAYFKVGVDDLFLVRTSSHTEHIEQEQAAS
jgi:transcriptional regulator with XRE-family HTH domain